MHIPKFAVFYDFHTMPACPDVGAGFDCDAAAEQLKRCGADFTIFAARCNLGMAYYDTKTGIRHPALKYDLFGRFLEACHKRGIAVSAYMNVGLSQEMPSPPGRKGCGTATGLRFRRRGRFTVSRAMYMNIAPCVTIPLTATMCLR